MEELGFGTGSYYTENKRYIITVAAITNISSDYIVTATAQSAQLKIDPSCKTFSIDYLMQKSATDNNDADSTGTCWNK
jgi:hypothetical protein